MGRLAAIGFVSLLSLVSACDGEREPSPASGGDSAQEAVPAWPKCPFSGITHTVTQYGAKGDGIADDGAAIQSAIDAASDAGGGTVYFPPGTYLLGTVIPGGGWLNNRLITLQSNVRLLGAGDQTILKMKDHLLDQSDAQHANFLHNRHLDGKDDVNICVENLTFDGNAANNLTPLGAARPAVMIRFIGGARVWIHDNRFLNGAGHNDVQLVDDTTFGGTSPNREAYIVGNVFLNGGHYTGTGNVENVYNSDFSFGYSEWASTVAQGNHIEQQNPDIALRGYTGGFEIHGSDSVFVDNTIIGCYPAMYVASTPKFLRNVLVSRNVLNRCWGGINFWIGKAMSDVTISDNTISVYAPPGTLGESDGIFLPRGQDLNWTEPYAKASKVERLILARNTITSALPADSTIVAGGMAVHSLWDSSIVDNLISGMTGSGITVSGSPWGTKGLNIERNVVQDCGKAWDDAGLARNSGIRLHLPGHASVPDEDFWSDGITVKGNLIANTASVGSFGWIYCGMTITPLGSYADKNTNLLVGENTFSNLPVDRYP